MYYWLKTSESLTDNEGAAKKALLGIKKDDMELYDWIVFYGERVNCKKDICNYDESVNRLLEKYPSNVYLNLHTNHHSFKKLTYENKTADILRKLSLENASRAEKNLAKRWDMEKFGLDRNNTLAYLAAHSMQVFGDFKNKCTPKDPVCRQLYSGLLKEPYGDFRSVQYGLIGLGYACKKEKCSEDEHALINKKRPLVMDYMSPRSYPLQFRQIAWNINETMRGSPFCDTADPKNECFKGPTEMTIKEKIIEKFISWTEK